MSTLAEFAKYSSSIPSFAAALERSLNPYEDRSVRVPFMFHSTWRYKRGIAPLMMKMNPQTVSFSQQKRTSERKTQSGSVFFHWTNANGENNDVLQVQFAGQTGNINMRTDSMKEKDWLANKMNNFNDWINEKMDSASEKVDGALGLEPSGSAQNLSGVSRLASFWNLYSLTAEPILDVVDGTPNITFITFSSPLFGNSSIRLEGHFNGVLEITDNATSPFNASYSFGFTAVSTTPEVSMIYGSIVSNLASVFTNKLD